MPAGKELILGTLHLKNRLLMAPVKTGFGTAAGTVTERHIAYYLRRAHGGVGAIIIEPMFIDEHGREHPKQLGLHEDAVVPHLRGLVRELHSADVPVIAHINHAGFAANPSVIKGKPEAPSPIMCPTTATTAQEMTSGRITTIVQAYGQAALRAKDAGLDAVEIQFGLGYLVAQFWSDRINKREDDYGGNSSNRRRFARGVLGAVRRQVGSDFPVIIRLSVSEMVDGGLGLEDAGAMADLAAEYNVVALHAVSGHVCESPAWYYQHMALPAQSNLELAVQLKERTSLPVIVAGRMGNPADIASAIDEHDLAAVALGRPLVADPDLPIKILENRDDEIAICGACLQGCLFNVKRGIGIGCNSNPEVGHERRSVSTESPRRVVVIGGGPAGMNAALLARQRGHEVILLEGEQLGGQAKLAGVPPGKETMNRLFDHIPAQLRAAGVDIREHTYADVDTVRALEPDEVLVASGSHPVYLAIPGVYDPLFGEDVLLERRKVGKNVLIVGGGMVGIECADWLVEREHNVTVIEMLDKVARDMDPITRKLTLQRLENRAKIYTQAQLVRMDGKKAYIDLNGSEIELGDYDSVVLAAGAKARTMIANALQSAGFKVHTIGDANRPGQFYNALRDAWEVVNSL